MSQKKPTAKKNKRMSSSKVEMMEKSFKEMPSLLVKQYNKDLTALRQQETSLKNNIKRAHSQKKSNQKMIMKSLTSQLNEIQKQIQKTMEGSQRTAALNKAIVKFNAEWKNRNRKAAPQIKKPQLKKPIARPVMNKEIMPVLREHTVSQDSPVNASTEVSELSTI